MCNITYFMAVFDCNDSYHHHHRRHHRRDHRNHSHRHRRRRRRWHRVLRHRRCRHRHLLRHAHQQSIFAIVVVVMVICSAMPISNLNPKRLNQPYWPIYAKKSRSTAWSRPQAEAPCSRNAMRSQMEARGQLALNAPSSRVLISNCLSGPREAKSI